MLSSVAIHYNLHCKFNHCYSQAGSKRVRDGFAVHILLRACFHLFCLQREDRSRVAMRAFPGHCWRWLRRYLVTLRTSRFDGNYDKFPVPRRKPSQGTRWYCTIQHLLTFVACPQVSAKCVPMGRGRKRSLVNGQQATISCAVRTSPWQGRTQQNAFATSVCIFVLTKVI